VSERVFERANQRYSAPKLASPAAEPVVLTGAEVVQAVFEHAGSGGATFLPPTLAPTIPTLVTLLAIRVPDGPRGGFTMAQVRVSCRSGGRPRALAVATAVDADADTVAWLAAGWGIGGQDGPVAIERRYDRVEVRAPWFDVAVTGPRPIGVRDVQYVTGLHPIDGDRLAQVELDVTPDRVERGRPLLQRFGAPDRAPGLSPHSPVAATAAVGTVRLPVLRFVL